MCCCLFRVLRVLLVQSSCDVIRVVRWCFTVLRASVVVVDVAVVVFVDAVVVGVVVIVLCVSLVSVSLCVCCVVVLLCVRVCWLLLSGVCFLSICLELLCCYVL